MDLPAWDEIAKDFKEVMGEFSDNTAFPPELIIKTLKITKYFFGKRWGDYGDYSNFQIGWFNYVAHSIFVTLRNESATLQGLAPSAIRGANTVTIADETLVYGSQLMMKLQPWTEDLASTTYGVEYLRRRDLVKKVGVMV